MAEGADEGAQRRVWLPGRGIAELEETLFESSNHLVHETFKQRQLGGKVVENAAFRHANLARDGLDCQTARAVTRDHGTGGV